MIIERINSPSDVKALTIKECDILCKELRSFLVEEVSSTGGHLASSLGVVELTIAIHRVFDTLSDRLVFDVGHQCYIHKAITGRKELFHTLRQFGGLSGFPKPYESPHDAFVAGHASNSISVALGMAHARTLQNKDYSVLALIGDGALGGGLSFEGLNDAGASGEPLIVILNDNGMSIAPNVGGMAHLLENLRSNPEYYEFKKRYHDRLNDNILGKKIYAFSHNVKTTLKKSLIPNATPFENMGFAYLGPVDGHDVEKLCYMLSLAKEMHCPVLLHVKTIKGKGYLPAEENPTRFHGIGPFDPQTGKNKNPSCDTFSRIFGQEMIRLAKENEQICAITAAMEDGTGLSDFAKKYPRRFFNVGIAESHAVAMAAGMAKQGMIPVVSIYSTFLQRSYDQLLHDVALQNLHVVFAVDRAGLVGDDGETHHGVFDVQYLHHVPDMTVLCPANFSELRSMLHRAIMEFEGPVAIRYPRGGEREYTEDSSSGSFCQLTAGDNGTILTYGILVNEAMKAAALLQQKGKNVRVIKCNSITDEPSDELISCLNGERHLLVLEDCMAADCVGQRIAAALCRAGKTPHMVLNNLGRTVPSQGTVPQLYQACHLDAQSIADCMEELCNEQ